MIKCEDNSKLKAVFTNGTQRTCLPETTLERIEPKLRFCGITRVLDITRLDRPGIPTCCAIRPTASVMQVSNGKGATKAAAQVSALMESIELFHAENSQHYPSMRQSQSDLAQTERVADHTSFASFRKDVHFTPTTKINWINGYHVNEPGHVWIPSCAVFFDQDRFIHATTTNGLASGNHLVEASLHALYEVIERDAGSRLSAGGTIKLASRGGVVDSKTIADPSLRELAENIDRQGKIIVCYVKSVINVHTFWVISLNNTAQSNLSAFNIGWGTHRNREIALSRALTESAQARLAIIHGAREDIITKTGYVNSNVKQSAAFRYFEKLEPTMKWSELPDYSVDDSIDIISEWNYLLRELVQAGYPDVYRVDLTRPDLNIPVVKIIVPGLEFNQRMF